MFRATPLPALVLHVGCREGSRARLPRRSREPASRLAAGKTVAEVARLLEVSDQSIYSWRRQEQIDNGELPGLSSAEREELRERGCGSGHWRLSWLSIGGQRSC